MLKILSTSRKYVSVLEYVVQLERIEWRFYMARFHTKTNTVCLRRSRSDVIFLNIYFVVISYSSLAIVYIQISWSVGFSVCCVTPNRSSLNRTPWNCILWFVWCFSAFYLLRPLPRQQSWRNVKVSSANCYFTSNLLNQNVDVVTTS